ncbi:trypsin-like peptidase domain-containing protein [Actinotalea sp.]|uniref:trypsin-like serine peptidase n=1 Tax=Actinotalea sp. TaxID=1872145 RepID=UPI002BA4EC5A|nr:trypsin-like peptidase domain-containing protein [Actinotalea sp.]HRA51548.1 trypsin-like peptidase domain-containing protein [Actinotalea sp.]
MSRRVSVIVLTALLLAGCTAGPDDVVPPGPEGVQPADPLPLDRVVDFSGIASLNAGSNCTGTLIDTGVPDGPAYVLTNGHCVGDVGRSAQRTTIGIEWFGTAEFFRADGNLDATLTVDVVELAYSTMRATDTAVIRLDATLDELADLGVDPVPITEREPAEGTEVVNVGVPVQDLMHDDWVMRLGECTLGAQHTVIEGAWLWFGVWSNDCPGIIQGSSGSPLLTLDADGVPEQVVAVINTTSGGVTADDGGACAINRPCQVADGVATMVEETSYAQSAAGIGECFDPRSGELELGDTCPLPVSSVWTERGGGSFRGGDLPDATGQLPDVSLVGSQPGRARTVVVPLGDGSACTSPATYDGALDVVLPLAGEDWELFGTVVPVDLPQEEGRYALCAVADDDYDGAASVLFDVDRTPPIVAAGASVEDIGDGAVVVRPHLDPPEITTVRFTWGPPDEVDCTDTDGFRDFFIAPLTLERADLPARYCLYGMDAAGNPTDVVTLEIPAP